MQLLQNIRPLGISGHMEAQGPTVPLTEPGSSIDRANSKDTKSGMITDTTPYMARSNDSIRYADEGRMVSLVCISGGRLGPVQPFP